MSRVNYLWNAGDAAQIGDANGERLGSIDKGSGGSWVARRYNPDGPDFGLGSWRYKRDAAQAVVDNRHSGHELHVTRFNAGGYPIAGWNWPMHGYRVDCSCGFKSGNVAGSTAETVKAHLEVTHGDHEHANRSTD